MNLKSLYFSFHISNVNLINMFLKYNKIFNKRYVYDIQTTFNHCSSCRKR